MILYVIGAVVVYIVLLCLGAIAVGKTIAYGMGNHPKSVQYVSLDELLGEAKPE